MKREDKIIILIIDNDNLNIADRGSAVTGIVLSW